MPSLKKNFISQFLNIKNKLTKANLNSAAERCCSLASLENFAAKRKSIELLTFSINNKPLNTASSIACSSFPLCRSLSKLKMVTSCLRLCNARHNSSRIPSTQ